MQERAFLIIIGTIFLRLNLTKHSEIHIQAPTLLLLSLGHQPLPIYQLRIIIEFSWNWIWTRKDK